MKIAFYLGTRSGFPGLYNRLVRWWEPGDCSHVELIFSHGASASASFMDHGVRFKEIDYDPANWLILDLGDRFDEAYALKWFIDHMGAPYDLFGQLHFVFSPFEGSKKRYWCSEAVAAALQLKDPWRYGPNLLKAVLTSNTQ